MNPSQTNTKRTGSIPVTAGEDLTGKRNRLVVLGNNGGTRIASLPTSIQDLALYQLNEEGASGAEVDVEPLVNGQQLRMNLKGTSNPGDIAVLADPATPADKGKIRKLPATAGVYVQIGQIEDVGVDTQDVRVRVQVGIVRVKSADTISGAADLTATKAAVLAILQAHGLVT